jgi:hypothetical protein
MPEYPSRFIKGIPHSKMITGDGIADQELFSFHDKDLREDGWIEQSINWQDDEKAVDFTLNQVKATGEIHFKGGVALVLTDEVERLKRKPIYVGKVDYERNKKDDNPYHGNLLVIKTLSKPTRRALAGYLALFAEIIPR